VLQHRRARHVAGAEDQHAVAELEEPRRQPVEGEGDAVYRLIGREDS